MVLPNPNFPLVLYEADFTQGPPNVVGTKRMSLNSLARRTTVTAVDIRRGRQYELDQTQAGLATLQIADPLEQLHPDNTGSPLNSGGNSLKPYRAARIAAIWPTTVGSGNQINTGFDSTYDPSFETTTGGWTRAGGTTTLATSTAQHFDGAKSMLVTQSAAGVGFGAVQRFPTGPTVTYVFSAYVYPTTGVTVQMQVVDGGGTTRSSATASTAGTWTRLTLTWDSMDTFEAITIYGTGTSTPTFYVDATMLEFGSTANTFTTTGPAQYPVFTGYIERYPLDWDMGGHRGQRALTLVDALAVLSRTVISQSYQATVLADSPALYMPLNDKALPQAVQMPSGGLPFLGYQNLGTSGQVSFAGDTFLDGSSAASVTQQNATPPIGANTGYITYLAAINGRVSMNPQNFAIEVWVKVSNGVVYVGAGSLALGETWAVEPFGPQYQVGWYTTNGRLALAFWDPNGSGTVLLGISNGAQYTGQPDGQWHHLVLRFVGSSQVNHICDGVVGGLGGISGTVSSSIGLNFLYADATTYTGNAPNSTVAVANMALYPSALTAAKFQAHYQRGIGYQGEKSGARVTRLLTQYWAGPMSVAAGYASMAPDYAYDTRTMLDVLQEIQETERGLLYVDRRGTVVFEDRTSRYANQTSLWTLGENPAGASPVEYPYSGYKATRDPTYTFSQTNLSRPGNTTVTPAVNTQAQSDYGQRIISQTVQVNSDFDVQQASVFYLNRYSSPKTRIENLTLNPAANPALWPLVLGLEMSQRFTVKRRTNALATSADYYVESINHKLDAKAGTWVTDLQESPVFVPSAWVLGDATYGVLGTTSVPVY